MRRWDGRMAGHFPFPLLQPRPCLTNWWRVCHFSSQNIYKELDNLKLIKAVNDLTSNRKHIKTSAGSTQTAFLSQGFVYKGSRSVASQVWGKPQPSCFNLNAAANWARPPTLSKSCQNINIILWTRPITLTLYTSPPLEHCVRSIQILDMICYWPLVNWTWLGGKVVDILTFKKELELKYLTFSLQISKSTIKTRIWL